MHSRGHAPAAKDMVILTLTMMLWVAAPGVLGKVCSGHGHDYDCRPRDCNRHDCNCHGCGFLWLGQCCDECHDTCYAKCCACDDGWKGGQCGKGTGCDADKDVDCGHGRCVADGGDHHCDCNGEWTLNNETTTSCTIDPCQNEHNDCGEHAQCRVEGNQHKCDCTYVQATLRSLDLLLGDCPDVLESGSDCTPACDGQPAPSGKYLSYEGDVSCDNGKLVTGTAKCVPCHEKDERDSTSWCAHEGTCVASGNDLGYTCTCAEYRGGLHCEESDPCKVSQPCQNGGTCNKGADHTDGTSDFTCSCPLGFMNHTCEEVVTVFDTLGQICDLNTQHTLCGVFDTKAKFIGSVLVAVLCAPLSIWVYAKLVDTQHLEIGRTVRTVIYVCAAACAACLVIATILNGKEILSSSLAKVLVAAGLALGAEIGVGMLWQNRREHFTRVRSTVQNRLWRGVVVPTLAVVAACPALAVYVVQQKPLSSAVERFVVAEHVWSVLSFGVVLAVFPMGVGFAKTYTLVGLDPVESSGSDGSDEDSDIGHHSGSGDALSTQLLAPGVLQELLPAHQVHRSRLFLRAHRWYVKLSGLLLPFVWLAYMSNELEVFLLSVGAANRRELRRDLVSIDGVRALTPVVFALNFAVFVLWSVALSTFPAPQEWSPFVFFGIIWSLLVVLSLGIATGALVWSLSEPALQATSRDLAARDQAFNEARRTLSPSSAAPVDGKTLCAKFCEWIVSWPGQTAMSTCNHLFSMALFLYGLDKYADILDETDGRARTWLITGIVLSGLGLAISGASMLERRFPQWKLTPTVRETGCWVLFSSPSLPFVLSLARQNQLKQERRLYRRTTRSDWLV